MTTKTAAKYKLKYTDLSAPNRFRFEFRCDRCGSGVRSEDYAFSADGYDPPPSGKALEFLWLRQHKEAFARAESEAQYEFNVCPKCGRRVCGDCFRLSPDGRADMCADCRDATKTARVRQTKEKRRRLC
jgi:hypothetical protein